MNNNQRFIIIRQDGYSETEILDANSLEELHKKLSDKTGR